MRAVCSLGPGREGEGAPEPVGRGDTTVECGAAVGREHGKGRRGGGGGGPVAEWRVGKEVLGEAGEGRGARRGGAGGAVREGSLEEDRGARPAGDPAPRPGVERRGAGAFLPLRRPR